MSSCGGRIFAKCSEALEACFDSIYAAVEKTHVMLALCFVRIGCFHQVSSHAQNAKRVVDFVRYLSNARFQIGDLCLKLVKFRLLWWRHTCPGN